MDVRYVGMKVCRSKTAMWAVNANTTAGKFKISRL